MRYEVDIRERSFNFALRTINLTKALPRNESNRILISQLVRSATSVGANLEEAKAAHTKAEFVNCTNIARREARETVYWLKLVGESNELKVKKRMEDLITEAEEIMKILTVSIKKLKGL